MGWRAPTADELAELSPPAPKAGRWRAPTAEEQAELDGRVPNAPEKQARIGRTIKAGQIEPEKPSFLKELGKSANDFAGATGSSFNENFALGLPARVMDLVGASSQEERDRLKERSAAGTVFGGAVGIGTSGVVGPEKAIADTVQAGAKALAPKVTSTIGGGVLRAGQIATTGAGIGAARAQVQGADVAKTLEEAQDFGTGALLFHGASEAGGKVAGKIYDKVIGGASKRIDTRAITDVATGAGAAGRQVMKTRDAVADTAREFNLGPAAKTGPEALAKATTAARDTVGPKIAASYKAIDEAAPAGVPIKVVTRALDGLRKEYAKLGTTKPEADAVFSTAKNLYAAHGERGAMSAQTLRQEITNLQGKAYKSLDPKGAAQVSAKVEQKLRDVLDGHVKGVAKQNPGVAEAVQALPTLNKQYSTLSTIQKAANAKLNKVPSANPLVPPKGLIRRGIAAGADSVARVADKGLARFALAVQRGGTRAELEALAQELQIPGQIASGLLNRRFAEGQAR